MSSETKLVTRNQRIVSGVFMFFILVFTIVLTYYSFNLSSSLKSLSDKSNPSITSYTNAFNSWDIALIALGVLILIITIIGVIFSPYIIIAFLFLFLLVLIALFIYTAIVLNALLGTSDYTSYVNGCGRSTVANCQGIVNNFTQGLNAAIILMVISGVMILFIIIFSYFMLRSLSKAGGLESEVEYVISKFQPDEKEKLQFDEDAQVEYNKRLVVLEAQKSASLGTGAQQGQEEVSQPLLTKAQQEEIKDIELLKRANLTELKIDPDKADQIISEIDQNNPDRNKWLKNYEKYKLNDLSPETAKANADYELYVAAKQAQQKQIKGQKLTQNETPSKKKVQFEEGLNEKIEQIKNIEDSAKKTLAVVDLINQTPMKKDKLKIAQLLTTPTPAVKLF